MNELKIIFSILTPTWNRSAYLRRVHASLNSQTFQRFEWIVADDGSSDETYKLVKDLEIQSNFPVTYIQADRHVGKAIMDNIAVLHAKGQFIVWCDSDDWLLPHTLQSLWGTWNTIPANQRDDYVGITALAATELGCIANPFPEVVFKDVSWNDLAEVHHVTGDLLFCARAEVLKEHPFPEVDFVIPESVIWTAMGHRLARLIPEVLLMKEYRAANAVSFTGTMAYNRGRAHALAATVRNLRAYHRPWRVRTWRLITFIRYSLHGEIPLTEALRLWGDNTGPVAFWLAYQFAVALAVKDRLQGKVRQTHREFLAAQEAAKVTVEVRTRGTEPEGR